MTSVDVEDGKNRSVVTEHQHHQTPPLPPPPVQGVSNYPPPPQQYPPASGYPQPAQPYAPGYVVAEGRPEYHDRLPCCGIGIGWFLFILGFFLGTIPWYIGFFLLLFSRNPRERRGYIACTIAGFVATIFIVIGVLRGSRVWS